jgi:hypothetical protein
MRRLLVLRSTDDDVPRWQQVIDPDTGNAIDVETSWREWATPTTLARQTDDGVEFLRVPG